MTLESIQHGEARASIARFLRPAIIATIAFLTLVDLFAMQAILPSLIAYFGVDPASMGVAVNTSTIGMALASLAISIFGENIDRRRGIALSLLLLAVPTFLLSQVTELPVFVALRVLQGIFMACAFTLMLAHLGEYFSGMTRASVFAAYIAGNVTSNFVGRLMSAGLVDHYGLVATFVVFASLNLAGAILVYFTLPASTGRATAASKESAWDILREHLADSRLLACFAIGFLILFAFIGTFTYVNLVLVAEPIGIGMMQLGFAYFVFVPSIFTTLIAGSFVTRHGIGASLVVSFALATAGLPLLISGSLWLVLLGLVIFAIGTFAAQAMVTGHISQIVNRGASTASGLYLASYFSGGLAGSYALGWIYVRVGWPFTVAAIGASLCLATLLSMRVARPSPKLSA